MVRRFVALGVVAFGGLAAAAAMEGEVLLPDGRPASGATVSIAGLPGSVRTDGEGRFRWRPDPPVPFDLIVVLAGGQYTAPVRVEKAPGQEPLRVRVSPLIAEFTTVTASRIPEKVEEAPASVTVVTGDELERRGARDLRSALALVAGVDVAPGGDGGPAGSVPELWGLKEFDAFLLVVDGVPWGGAFNPSLETLSLIDVDRIEVLRGPAPVTYGATSFVGVIQVVHREPGEGEKSAQVAGGSYDSYSAQWLSSLPRWAQFQSSLSVDVGRRNFRDDRSGFERAHLRWRNRRALGSGLFRFDLDATWLRQDPASPVPRVGTTLSPDVPLDSNQNPKGAFLDQARFALNAGYERSALTGKWQTTLSATRAEQRVLRGFLVDVSTVDPNAHGFRETIPSTDVYFDTHMALSPSSRVELVAGVDNLYGEGNARGGDFDYFVNLDGRGAPSGSDLPSQAAIRITDRRDFAGLYGQVRWEPAERWHLEMGVRLNHTAEHRRTKTVDFASGTTVSGQDRRNLWRGSGFAGVSWTAWKRDLDSLNAYVDYRNTYKPAAVDFGLDSESEILAPETAESYEAGLKSRLLEGKLAIDLSAFRMDFQNLVVSQSVGGTPTLVNAGTTRFSGLELEAAWRLHPNLTWRLGTSLHDARFRDFVTEFAGVPAQLAGNRVEMSARNMASTGLVHSRDRGWQGHLEVSWVGSRFLNKRNTARAPAYATWGGGVGYRRDKLEIRLDGWNLNDQRPPVAESELGDAQYYLLPARRIEMTLLWTFGS